ncbi:MAG: FmdB family zinc ribbon protein [Thermomicrobiales bacterium]
MPTYAYRCSACAHEFETVQTFSEDPLKFCPECGSPVRRVIFPVGIVFKGSGWYINDSRSGGDNQSDKAAKSDTSADSDKKVEKDGTGKSDPAAGSSSSTKETPSPAPKPAGTPSKAAAD